VTLPVCHGLASSLNTLSLRLSDLGRREEAPHAIQEAVELHRQLATVHPAALNHLSLDLEEASSATKIAQPPSIVIL
jgi:hypothetical protein